MEYHSDNTADSIGKTINFLRQVGLRSEAYLKGDDWVKSALADLKIDHWLATEHGEAENTTQVEWIHRQIEIYQKVLHKTVFDPDPTELDGGLAIQAAAADLGQYVVQIARRKEAGFAAILSAAEQLLDERDARIFASECMQRVSNYCGIVHDDIGEVIKRAKHLLSCCK